MSASLVSSEMCIRDRSRLSVRARAAQTWAAVSGWLRSGLLADGIEAVSYTHLTLPTICSV
eukprot:6983227-Alexandrium_andersonii.AAC.1